MKKQNVMKAMPFISIIVLALLMLAACSDSTGPVNGEESFPPDSSLELNAETITLEEISSRAAGYYPDEVSFQFAGQDKITDESDQDGFVDQECYLFDVIHEGQKVSGVAVGTEDGSVWILDMYSKDRWLSESFMGLPESAGAETVKREPIIDLMSWGDNQDKVDLYFARLDAIPEFSNQNEGSVQWNETEKTLTIGAVKGTGSVTGAIDGPLVEAVVAWGNGEPELLSVEYEPAPIFSHPSQVLASGEIMNIETGRLIEIAEYFRALVQEELKDLD